MRPGPGLVVMALAFISGARRGSTSSISSKTTTTSSPPPPTLQILTTTTPASSLTLFQTTVTTSPTSSSSFSFISSTTTTTSTSTPPPTTGDTITTTSSPPPLLSTQPINIYENFGFFGSPLFKEQENDHQYHLSKRPKQPVPFNFFNTFFTRNSYNSYPSTSNYFAHTYPLPSHLTQHYDDPRARTESNTALHSAKHTRRATTKSRRRRKRRTRSANVNYRGSGTGSDDAIENLNDSDDTLTSLTTAVDSSSDSALSDQTTLARGLPVHFPSLTAADSSRSLDEDDIFALVAEDDLLSEESFDHLVKLTNDKIGDTNEEDYSSGTETVVESSSGSGSGAPDNAHDTTDQQNAIEDFVRVHQHQQQQQQQQQEPEPDQQQDHNEHPQLQDDDDGDNGTKEKPNEDHDSEQDDVDTVYTAHLVGNSNEKVVSVAETDSTHSSDPDKVEKENKLVTATTKTTTTTTTHPKAELDSPNRYHTILGSNFALTRLNPWISACDLAQPGPLSAPDLQGECSAGTLPVARVDEGPGPPTCLKSCKEETPFTNKLNKDNMINNLINNNNNNSNNNNNNNSKQNKNKSDNKLNKLVGYTTTTNTFNIKLRNSQPTISHSMNTNNNNNNNNNKNMDDNNNNNNSNNNNKSFMKLLNPFNYYQINNYNTNNNKMAKLRRNSKETTSNHSDVASRSTTTNVTMSQRAAHNDSQSQALSTLHSSEDYELLHDMLMQQDEAATNTQQNQQDQYNDDGDHQYHHHQFNDAAIAAAAVVMQLNQQQQQHNNNNNIVKMKLTATNYNDNNSNYNSNHFELKYNHLKKLHAGNSNSNNNNNNNNRRYQSINNINNSQQRFNTSFTMKSHAVAANNDNSDQYLKIPPPEKQQQQCLEYLGDSETTMPSHLCHFLTPSDRLAQLRHLRLRNCCERNVYSALHTMALNATLSGGTGCLRVLQDLMDLDALASRITCGLTAILFRFDCRQVYSIIHQCDDCKEAYRRWVCSTLVPYFAETSDVMRPPEILTTTIDSTSVASGGSNHVHSPNKSHKSQSNSLNSYNTTMASNMTTSHTAATSPNNKNNKNGTDMSSAMPTKTATSNFITNSNNNKHDMQYNANNYQQHFYMQQQQHRVKRRNIQMQQQQQQLQQHIINHILIDNNSSSSSSSNNNNNSKINDIHYETILIHHKNQPQQLHPSTITQALIFNDIITLNPRTTSPRNPLRSTTARLHSINATNEPAFGLNLHHKSTNKRRKRSDNSTTTTIYADVVVNRPSKSSSSPPSPSSSHASSTMHQMQRQKQQQQQSFNFISTANNEDSFYATNPVITKLLKRSKRKEFEFRKRRRIRPCLSVCQTVEQKCPYLLPADRAPSMPTQYAGEPTFLCLDYNIAETEEQLSKASHGPNECCYTYCSSSPNGICTYCNDMWDKTETDKEAEFLSEERETKVLNIKMKPKGRVESEATIRVETRIQQKMGEEKNGLKMSTVAIEVRNDTAFENATRLAERLQYYAFCDGVFYYDDDADDMPEYPNSENCRALPPVQSRCIPYYATNYISSADMLGSYRKNNEAQKLLIWLSTLLCLWSCYSARSMRLRRCNEDKRQQKTDQPQQQLTHQQQHKTTNTAYRRGIMCQSCQTREIMQNEGNCKKVIKLCFSSITNNQHQHYHHYYYCNNYNYTSLKYKPNNNSNILINNKTLTSTLKLILMTDLILKIMATIMIMLMIMLMLMRMLIMLIMPLLFKSFLKMKYNNNHHMKNIKSNLSFSPNTSYNSEKTNYRYFYYYNFNINDWWQRRRWWRRRWRRPSTPHPLVDHHYATESLLMSGVSSQPNFFQHILL
ncbi:serine-rich adhesin for platelets [Calliphora vicina]|uniref:serine-rich adhesin for platelets n=1 Tax=Calliphora vicina TaxID=7373 RepID=UPI00325B3CAD